MPPPRHPMPASAAEPTELESTAPSVEKELHRPALTALTTEHTSSPAPTSVQLPVTPVEIPTIPQEMPAEAGERPSRPATLYLEEAHIDFLEEARIAGMTSRPRLDISKSAVVRLALRRLQQEMTIDEIPRLPQSSTHQFHENRQKTAITTAVRMF